MTAHDFPEVVSETALVTLRARALEAGRKNPVIEDAVGQEFLDRLRSLLPSEIRNRLFDKRLSPLLTRHIAQRARKYDSYAESFIEGNPGGLVVSLGCGFDTRYWRVSDKPWRYVEVDLPDVIRAKRSMLPGEPPYPMIGSSVLENAWLDEIMAIQRENILFLAEGLFMYLAQPDVQDIFARLSESFSNSSIVFEVVNKRYTTGIWKKIVAAKMRRALGTEAGSSYDFGVYDAREVESYGKNIVVTREWSWLEDEDIKPHFLRLLRSSRLFSRAQWTIRAQIA
jgi:methyltransferase (TIGR00027 family)